MKCHIKSIEVNQHAVSILAEAQRKALELTIEAIRTDIVTRGVVPFENGILQNGGDMYRSGYTEQIDDCVYYLVYNTPYARIWYYNLPTVDKNGKHYSPAKFKRPTAIDHWMDYYLDGEGKQWVIEKYLVFLKQESKGVIT